MLDKRKYFTITNSLNLIEAVNMRAFIPIPLLLVFASRAQSHCLLLLPILKMAKLTNRQSSFRILSLMERYHPVGNMFGMLSITLSL